MTEYRLNAYHIMWLFVFFDLPVSTKKEMKAAALFRKNLEKDGFSMMQFSVYIRHCASRESLGFIPVGIVTSGIDISRQTAVYVDDTIMTLNYFEAPETEIMLMPDQLEEGPHKLVLKQFKDDDRERIIKPIKIQLSLINLKPSFL